MSIENSTVKYMINYTPNKLNLIPSFVSYDEVNREELIDNPFRGTPCTPFPLDEDSNYMAWVRDHILRTEKLTLEELRARNPSGIVVEFSVPEEKLLPYEEEDFHYESHANEDGFWESLFKHPHA